MDGKKPTRGADVPRDELSRRLKARGMLLAGLLGINEAPFDDRIKVFPESGRSRGARYMGVWRVNVLMKCGESDHSVFITPDGNPVIPVLMRSSRGGLFRPARPVKWPQNRRRSGASCRSKNGCLMRW